MTVSSETYSNLEFSEHDRKRVGDIASKVETYARDAILSAENNPLVEKYTPNETELEKLNEWRNVSLEALQELGCGDLLNSVPKIEKISFLRLKDNNSQEILTGGVDDTGQEMVFLLGESTEITSERFRKVFLHEVAHTVVKRVVTLDEENNPKVLQQGFERITSIISEPVPNTEMSALVTYSKAAFMEPLAVIFSYYCSDKMGYDNHYFDSGYIRETCFVLGLLDRMTYENDSSFKEEFAKLFSSFNHRDFRWFKYAIDVYANIISKESDASDAESHQKAISLFRDMIGIEVENGVDVMHENDHHKWGYNLTDVAEKGFFDSNYNQFCNFLVKHTGKLKFTDTTTYLA